ncbi:hypothetical protein VFPPC_02278 [Pochonia chlamydosporia 170]|uniref:Uncharacterized protein n=1 Tax=Pochonia chlamydosporia 170 TaxID=1380566 RepID=A0A179FVN7_METCM|nr:hypothetical protein VFPPC_02278 [Pochonia chlamydosporia 170]OAQ69674.2 hypothetical protein VFPPC_02278 [Pochonia chlamydosporia 170]
MIERAHIIRAPYEKRMKDKVWITCMLVLITGFGAISVTAFVWPNSEVSPEDRKCRIGQLLKVTVPLLTYDIIINVSLTTLFVHLLHPFLAPKGNRVSLGHSLSSPNQDRVIGRLRRLVMKTIIGAILIMVPTLANLSVTWTVTVVHWLTANSQDVDDDLRSYYRSYHRSLHGNNLTPQSRAISDSLGPFKNTTKPEPVALTGSASPEVLTRPPPVCMTAP